VRWEGLNVKPEKKLLISQALALEKIVSVFLIPSGMLLA